MFIFSKIAEAAAVETPIPTLGLLQKITDVIINPAIRLFMGVALVVFLWGVVEFLRNSDNEKAQESGKQHMFWGVIGLTIMVSALGILNLVNSIWEK